MFDDLGGLLQTALGVVAIGALAGLGALRETLKQLRERLTEEQTHSAGLEERVAKLEAGDQAKEAEIVYLRRMKTNQATLDEVSDKLAAFGVQLANHNTSAEEHWQRDEDLLGKILDAVRNTP